jgi:hypothetical protein
LSENTLANIGLHSVEPWVEEVDFRLLDDTKSRSLSKSPISAFKEEHFMHAKSMPSLDQISAHLSSLGHVSSPPLPKRSSMRLPAFLLPHSTSLSRASAPADAASTERTKPRPSLPIGAGSLQIPDRQPPIPPPQLLTATSAGCPIATLRYNCGTVMPTVQVTVTSPPRSAMSPTELSEKNVLMSRARTAQDMLSTLRRRVHPSEQGLIVHDQGEERKGRRRSSPAEMQPTERSGFRHPVLSMPGGF